MDKLIECEGSLLGAIVLVWIEVEYGFAGPSQRAMG